MVLWFVVYRVQVCVVGQMKSSELCCIFGGDHKVHSVKIAFLLYNKRVENMRVALIITRSHTLHRAVYICPDSTLKGQGSVSVLTEDKVEYAELKLLTDKI